MDDLMRPAGRPFAWARTAHRISPDLKPCYALSSKKADHFVARFAVSWIRCAKPIVILQHSTVYTPRVTLHTLPTLPTPHSTAGNCMVAREKCRRLLE